MNRIQLVIITMAAVAVTACAAPSRSRPVEEGYLVAGVEGQITKDPNENQWRFFPAVQITDGRGLLPPEKGITLLPCSVLEQVMRLAGDEPSIQVRLWAVITEYRAENFLYSLYFLPMKSQPEEVPPKPAEPKQPAGDQTKPKESVLPTEILQMIQKAPIPDLKRLDEAVVTTSDRNLIHRTGLMESMNGDVVYKPDAFGQNVGRGTYHLLPCRMLEHIERSRKTPGRQRYVVSGVVTACEGKDYLLLRRAVRTFTHGNFTP